MAAIPTSVVLIAEPDEATSALYQRALRTAFTVIAVTDEVTIVNLMRTRPVAAVVLEPTLFAAQCWESVTRISRMCIMQNIPLVICSTLDERRQGLALGATAYLVKPTLPAMLLDTLHHVIAQGNQLEVRHFM